MGPVEKVARAIDREIYPDGEYDMMADQQKAAASGEALAAIRATLEWLAGDADRLSRTLARYWRPDLYDDREPILNRCARELEAERQVAAMLRVIARLAPEGPCDKQPASPA